MNKIIYVGVDYKKGLGGVASVLFEYSKIIDNSIFIATTSETKKLTKFLF